MSEEQKQEATTESVNTTPPQTEAAAASTDAPVSAPASAPAENERNNRGPRQSRDRRNTSRRPRRGGRRDSQPRQEFEQKIVSIRRVTRVMAGGRRFSFSVSMVIGDKKGRVGVGVGKAGDTQLAIEKAVRNAKKHMITVVMNKDSHIPHDVRVKLASSEVMIMPAPGRGLVAGSSVRTVLELAGVTDVTAKIFSRSKNKLNNARAAIAALKELKA